MAKRCGHMPSAISHDRWCHCSGIVRAHAQGAPRTPDRRGRGGWRARRGRGLARMARQGPPRRLDRHRLVDRFPDGGLRVGWRTPINGGYAGPAVAGGRVFVTDARRVSRQPDDRARHRARRSGPAASCGRGSGRPTTPGSRRCSRSVPRATPTVDGDRVYVLGTMGNLLALDVGDGRVLWQKDFVKDFDASVPSWGMTVGAARRRRPADRLVGGEPNGEGDGVQQAHRRRDLARAVVGLGAGLQPADHHRGRAARGS